jgi:hypothetical protein
MLNYTNMQAYRPQDIKSRMAKAKLWHWQKIISLNHSELSSSTIDIVFQNEKNS